MDFITNDISQKSIYGLNYTHVEMHAEFVTSKRIDSMIAQMNDQIDNLWMMIVALSVACM